MVFLLSGLWFFSPPFLPLHRRGLCDFFPKIPTLTLPWLFLGFGFHALDRDHAIESPLSKNGF
jgi:hypothetical protein